MPNARADESARGVKSGAHAAFGRSQPVEMVGPDAGGAKEISSVLDGVQVAEAAGGAKVCARGPVIPDTRHALRVIRIVMILMHGADDLRYVHNRNALGSRFPHEPLVPVIAANHEVRKFGIKPARKDEV